MKRLMFAALALCVTGNAFAIDAVKKAAPTAQPKDKAMTQIDQMIADAKVDKTKSDWRTMLPMFTVAKFDSTHSYYARMVTSEGTILIKFMPDIAPQHVTNFIYLAKLGYYDGLAFHRVIPGFMAQGGCPLGTGTGGPGYGFNGEFSPKARHDRGGLLSMANTGRPNSDGSQFFLTFVATPWLNDKHTIFGEVVEGKDVLKKLESFGSSPSGATSKKLTMDKVTIEVK